eukprot:m51a1_g646 hypothetical protein (655) ;mRNA; r:182624-184648
MELGASLSATELVSSAQSRLAALEKLSADARAATAALSARLPSSPASLASRAAALASAPPPASPALASAAAEVLGRLAALQALREDLVVARLAARALSAGAGARDVADACAALAGGGAVGAEAAERLRGAARAMLPAAEAAALRALGAAGWPKDLRGGHVTDSVSANLLAALGDCRALADVAGRPPGGAACEWDARDLRAFAEGVVAPVVRRFRYHFAGARPTADRTRPEWALGFVSKTVSDSRAFLSRHVQPALGPRRLAATTLAAALVEEVSKRLAEDVERAAAAAASRGDAGGSQGSQGALLLKVAAEALAFDETMRGVAPGCPCVVERVFCAMPGAPARLEQWMSAEVSAAASAFDSAVGTEDCWSQDSVEQKAPASAVRVAELSEVLFQRCALLPTPELRLQFVSVVVAPLLQRYAHEAALARTGGCELADQRRTYALCNACAHVEACVEAWQQRLCTPSEPAYDPRASAALDTTLRSLASMRKDLVARATSVATGTFAACLAPLFTSGVWEAPHVDCADSELDASPAAARALEALAAHLRLARAELRAPLAAKLARKVCAGVARVLMEELVREQRRVSSDAARQFERDVVLAEELVRAYEPRAPSVMRKVTEAARLMRDPSSLRVTTALSDNEIRVLRSFVRAEQPAS